MQRGIMSENFRNRIMFWAQCTPPLSFACTVANQEHHLKKLMIGLVLNCWVKAANVPPKQMAFKGHHSWVLWSSFVPCTYTFASLPGHSQILSRSHGEKSGEGLVPLLRHRPELVDSVSGLGFVMMATCPCDCCCSSNRLCTSTAAGSDGHRSLSVHS